MTEFPGLGQPSLGWFKYRPIHFLQFLNFPLSSIDKIRYNKIKFLFQEMFHFHFLMKTLLFR